MTHTKRFNIVLEDNKDFVLASCKTKEFAENYLKDIIETDKQLQKYYRWDRLPKYLIIESEGNK